MDKLRKVVKVSKGVPAIDGAGVKLFRVIGYNDTKAYDPFLMLDAFDSENPDEYINGFPWHPHRGMETITYLIHGHIEHKDSLGNSGSILDGECQWMTAGSGIIHQEMPKESKHLLGLQLWLNLPAKYKMVEPSYGDIKAENVPIANEDGTKIRIIAGEYKNLKGAFKGKYIDVTFLDIELPRNEEWKFSNDEDNTLFVYIFSGKANFDPNKSIENRDDLVDEKQAVLFSHGNEFYVKAGMEGVRFILLSAKPINEPIAWGGPIVMNTEEELRNAFGELDNDTFIK